MHVNEKQSQKVIKILSKILYKRFRESSKIMASASSKGAGNTIEFRNINIKTKPPIELNRLAVEIERPKFNMGNIVNAIGEIGLMDLVLSIETRADSFTVHLKTSDAKRLILHKNPLMFIDAFNGKREFVIEFSGIPVEYGSVRVAEFANYFGDFYKIGRVKSEENGLSFWNGKWSVTYSKIWVELSKQVVLDSLYVVKLVFDEVEAKEMFRIYQEETAPVSSDTEYEYLTEYETNGIVRKRRNKKRVKRITKHYENSLLKGVDCCKKTLSPLTKQSSTKITDVKKS
uniref:Uncharacterized protein n=1 Tax=Clytia hemisphaerica TaxID=252671 RepID=A0A7M5X699_9CNID|eukprot:TCONS_00060834-protein